MRSRCWRSRCRPRTRRCWPRPGPGACDYGALPPDAGPVTVAAQNDPAGRAAAFRIGVDLEVRRRPWRVRMPRGDGADWADVAGEVAAERAAIQWEGGAADA